MTKKIILIAVFCGVMSATSGQNSSPCPCDSLLEKIREQKLTGDFYLIPLSSLVSQFFTDDWLSGSVLLFNKVTVPVKYLKYNGYIDHLVILSENYTQIKLDMEPILSFSLFDKYIPGKTYLFEKIRIPAIQKHDSLVFAQLLYKDSVSVYVQRKVIKIGGKEVEDGGIIMETYDKRNIYFFMKGGEMIKEFRKISKKSILEIFSAEKESISRMMRSQKRFRIRTEDDLIRFTEWFNHNLKTETNK